MNQSSGRCGCQQHGSSSSSGGRGWVVSDANKVMCCGWCGKVGRRCRVRVAINQFDVNQFLHIDSHRICAFAHHCKPEPPLLPHKPIRPAMQTEQTQHPFTHTRTRFACLASFPRVLLGISFLRFLVPSFTTTQHNYTTSPARITSKGTESSVINKEDVAYLSMSLFVDLFRVYPANVGRYYTMRKTIWMMTVF